MTLKFFSTQYPKRYRKSSHRGPFEAEHLRGNKTAFLTPKRYDEQPRPFYIGGSPG